MCIPSGGNVLQTEENIGCRTHHGEAGKDSQVIIYAFHGGRSCQPNGACKQQVPLLLLRPYRF